MMCRVLLREGAFNTVVIIKEEIKIKILVAGLVADFLFLRIEAFGQRDDVARYSLESTSPTLSWITRSARWS